MVSEFDRDVLGWRKAMELGRVGLCCQTSLLMNRSTAGRAMLLYHRVTRLDLVWAHGRAVEAHINDLNLVWGHSFTLVIAALNHVRDVRWSTRIFRSLQGRARGAYAIAIFTTVTHPTPKTCSLIERQARVCD